MIIGYNFLGKGLDGQFFTNNTRIGKINYHELKNSAVDYEKIDSAIVPYDMSKKDWDYNTIIRVDFLGNLEISNFSEANLPVTHLRIKKRGKDSLLWKEVKLFEFDSSVINYQYEDKLVECLETYDYAIQPIGTGGILGNETVVTLDVDYDGFWVLNNDNEQFKFDYGFNSNIQIGDISTLSKSTVVETLDGQYPIFTSNNLNYRRFSVTTLLLNENNKFQYGTLEYRKAEKKYRKKVEEFLKDGKPKIIKESEELYLLGVIPKESVSLTPINELDRQLCEVSFEIVEIGSIDDGDLLAELGFIPKSQQTNFIG